MISKLFLCTLKSSHFNYYRSERDEKQPENGEKQGKAEVSRAILFLKHGSRSY